MQRDLLVQEHQVIGGARNNVLLEVSVLLGAPVHRDEVEAEAVGWRPGTPGVGPEDIDASGRVKER